MIGFHVRRSPDRAQPEILELAAEADRLGYSTIWISEAWGRDAFVLLAQLARTTSRTRLGTGIVNVFSRSPGELAMAAATLDEASGGRAVLGLGVSGARVIEDWHGMPWDRPFVRLREVTEVVRLALQGERVDYQGEVLKLRGFRLQFPPVRASLPIYWGVYSPKSIRSAGRIADGWLAGELPLRLWPEAKKLLADGATESGRPVPPTSLMLQVTACETEAEVVAARALMRRDIAFRVGGLGEFHRRALAESGFGAVCAEVAGLWSEGRRAESTAAVTDSLVDAMGCIGSPIEVAAYVQAAAAAGVEEPLVTVPQGTPAAQVVATLVACAPARVGQ
jgi:probable F420-dependent oxidoreductase